MLALIYEGLEVGGVTGSGDRGLVVEMGFQADCWLGGWAGDQVGRASFPTTKRESR